MSNQPLKRDKTNDAEIRRLWAEGALSAAQIGARFGCSKSTVIGLVHKRKHKPRAPRPAAPATTLDRLAALNAAMDRVMAETGAALAKDRARYRAYVANREMNQEGDRNGKRIPAYGYPRAARG